MKIDRLNYQKTFNLGNYESEKVGSEGQLEEGDDIMECYQQLKKAAEKFHKDNNPQLTDGVQPVEWSIPIGPNIPSVDYKAKENAEKQIDNATTLEDLEKLLVDAAKYNLVSQFNEKKKMLQ